jgi:hypothetical protein
MVPFPFQIFQNFLQRFAGPVRERLDAPVRFLHDPCRVLVTEFFEVEEPQDFPVILLELRQRSVYSNLPFFSKVMTTAW